MAGIWSVCVVVLWVWWGMGKDRRRKEIIVIIIFLYLTVRWDCVRGGMGEGGDFCVWGMCGVRRQACAWGIVYCCLVFGAFCGLLARFLVSIGCLYVFPEKVP